MQFFLLIIEITSFKGNTKKYNNFLLYNNNLNKKLNFNFGS